MYCPKCGCEYRPGYTICSDCQVDLIEEEPLIIQEEVGNMKMRLQNHKMGLISFLISMVTIVWFVITAIIDIFFTEPFSMNIGKNAFIEANILLFINFVGLVMGVASLSKNGYRKTLAIWGIAINSLLPVTWVISILLAIIDK